MTKTHSDPTVTPLQKVADTATAIIKVVMQSRPAGRIKPTAPARPIIIMGNGPSLRQTIDTNLDILEKNDTLAVNFAANTPEFFQIKPRYYVLADPFFFNETKAENVISLYENLGRVDWPMTLIVPVKARIKVDNNSIDIKRFNMVGIDGAEGLKQMLFDARLAMPRPRNVLIPSIMSAIWLGYKDIYIVGADHSWMKTIDVDSDNRVVSIQPHFYKDNKKELDRSKSAYANILLHEVVHSFYVAFKAYHAIARYAAKKGIRIFNATPESFIDAFERRKLESLRDDAR